MIINKNSLNVKCNIIQFFTFFIFKLLFIKPKKASIKKDQRKKSENKKKEEIKVIKQNPENVDIFHFPCKLI